MINIERLSNDKLEKISGGGVEWLGVGLAIAAVVIFLAGVIEGYTNPGRCEAISE